MVATLTYPFLNLHSKLAILRIHEVQRELSKQWNTLYNHLPCRPWEPLYKGPNLWNGINNILSFGSTLSILGVSKYEQSLFHISCSSNHCTCKECKGREKKVFWWWEWWTQNQKCAKETILIMRCCTQKKVTSPVCRDTQREDDQRGGALLWRRVAWNLTITFKL